MLRRMDVAAFKEGQKTVWSLGEFADIAFMIRSASDTVIEKAGVSSGDKLLDVACGTGNLAIPAAQRGANVTAMDITPKLLERAKAEAAEFGLEIDFSEGDAEALVYPDDSFDKTISVFGMIFAPQHELAASEMERVTRPGGTVAITAWTTSGMNGSLFKVMAKHMAMPDDMPSAADWGEESYVEQQFEDEIDWSFSREIVTFRSDSVEDWIAYNELKLGPMVMAKAALEPQGKWDALRADLAEHYERFNVSTDGRFAGEAEYLLAVGTLPG
jgi:ubiquinone/menaquinone biosynthesis C-methylase UbiE